MAEDQFYDKVAVDALLAELDAAKAAVAQLDNYVPRQAIPPDHTVSPAYVDTSVTPPVLKAWDGSAFVAASSSGSDATAAKKAANLSDLADAGTSRANLRVPILSSCQAVAWEQTTLSGLQTLDGYTTAATDRVLLTAQTNPVENGPWLAATGAWTRPTDFPTGGTVKGRSVHINAGTRFGGTVWVLATSATVTIDTDATTWNPSYQKSDDRNLRPRKYRKQQPVDRVTTFDSGHGFTSSGSVTSFADNTSDFLFGSQCVEIVVPAGSTGNIIKNGVTARDTTAKHAVVWIKTADLTTIQEIDLYVGSGGMTSFWRLAQWTSTLTLKPTMTNRWTPIKFTWADQVGSATGSPNRATVTDYKLAFTSVAGSALDIKVGGIDWVKQADTFPNGAVVFTFDDGLLTQYTAGRPILDRYGYKGTMGVVVGRLDTGGVNMSTAQMRDLAANGWEVCGHAFDEWVHVARLTGVTLAQADADLRALKQWLVDFGSTSDSFIYPGGFYADASASDVGVIDLVGKYFAQSRTIRSSPQYNIPGCLDPLFLTCYDPAGGTLATAKALVDKVFANGTILIFENHTIGTGGLSVANLSDLVDYIATKGVEVVTLQEAFDRLQVPSIAGAAAGVTVAAGDARYRLQTDLPQTLLPKVKSADQTVTNSITRVNDTDLDMTGLVAGGVYKVKATLYYSASTAGDLSIKWAGTVNAGGTVLTWTARGLSSVATATTSAVDVAAKALATPVTLGGIGVGVGVTAVVEGTLFVGSIGGDLQLTWAQATADASDAVMNKGSMLEMTRIA